ncbi:MAG: protein kinase [Acidobacteria bacterium]|nr:protein kinase [Acidobacteriota bacterium]
MVERDPKTPSYSMSTPDERLFGSDHEPPPQQFGRFLIKRIIGRGGMGIVYQAEQTEPFHRDVALKFIRRGSYGEGVIKRFKLERQALAVMNHENIARVFDADATEDGQPYFVMEYVAGDRIDHFCDQNKLNLEQRLLLFRDVCDAVQHAHMKGVIHRDLKPSNILVTQDGNRMVPKVIDFGVVKPLDPSMSGDSLHTEQGKLMGTPQYMSPEQLSMGQEDVDTRADVYALGVLLFELLTGTLPYEDKWDNVYQYIVNVRKADPPLASVRVRAMDREKIQAVAATRGVEPEALMRRLSGDLDWMLLRALAKDRNERYATASGMATDIDRYLRDEPVWASKPTWTYLMRKFVRRHKLGVAVALAFLAVLVGGIATTSYAMVRAQKASEEADRQRLAAVAARDQAEEAERRSQAVNQFLTNMISSADPEEGHRDVKVVDVLAQAANQVNTSFADEPAVESAVRRAIGQTFLGLGLYDEAQAQIDLALQTSQHHLPTNHKEIQAGLRDLADVHYHRGRYKESEAIYRRLLDTVQSQELVDPVEVIDLKNNLALSIKFQGRLQDAIPLYREALAFRIEHFGPDDDRTIESMNNLAVALKRPEEKVEAESLMRQVFEKVRVVKGENHPWTLSTLNNLAYLQAERGDMYEAIVFHRACLARRIEVLGELHPRTLQSRDALTQCLLATGQLAEAHQQIAQAVDGFKQVLRPDHPNVLRSSLLLVGVLVDVHDVDAAQRAMDELEPRLVEAFGADSRLLFELALHRLGLALHLGGPVEQQLARLHEFQLDLPWYEAVIDSYSAASKVHSTDDLVQWDRANLRLSQYLEGAERHYARMERMLAEAYDKQSNELQVAATRKRFKLRWPDARTELESIQKPLN